ncbi:hypothetical protein RHSIM_Rhsim02G0206700 [Rhododendron simsii]|uniref:Senescence-associated protein n=1 Tax=Rhododendron simsii TaxID=118357 RepID=A0A834H8W5_RHOSS|nr:hypothetical protein RHSIM_Rhsim02G0206700 [Rhododendron simsii]
MSHGEVLNKAIATLAYSNFVVLFAIPIVNVVGLCTNNVVNPIIQAWMVGLSVSLFLVLAILFCLNISRSPSETDAFGFLDRRFNTVVGVLAFFYLLHWAALVHKGNDGGRELSKKAAYEEEYYRFPAGCLEYWMEKETSRTSNEQPAENHTERHWRAIRECMIHNRFCERMSGEDWANMTLDQFYAMNLSSIESGCCKPPNDCNYHFISPTNWTTTADSTYTNPDCRAWANDPNILCFDCHTCKVGVADTYRAWLITDFIFGRLIMPKIMRDR